MPKKIPDIPYLRLSEGIKLCFQNFMRLQKDANILQKTGSYLSALPFLIYAKEELAKTILLFEKYKKKEDFVHGKRLKQTFENHPFKLREFTKFMLSEGRDAMDSKEVERYLTSEYYLVDEENRKDAIYVDWTDRGWVEPSRFFFTRDTELQDIFNRQRFECIENEINFVLSILIQDNNFKKICGIDL